MIRASQRLIRSILPIAITFVSGRVASAYNRSCQQVTYHPAAYTNGNAGDIALTVAESQLVQGVEDTLQMQYGHSAMLYDDSGNTFTESTTGNATPPSSRSTGEPHVCSRVISPYYMQRLSPGVLNATMRDARDGVLVKGGGAPYCTAPVDSYHINSIKYNDIHGGSCAAMNEADCGAQVSGWWQRTFDYWDHYTAAIFLYEQTYDLCTQVIDASWPWNGIGCGGVSATGEYYGLEQGGNASACDRAGSQVVNEFAKKAGTDCAAGVCDGWSDYDVFGDPLGDAKDNWQVGADWYNQYQDFVPRVPDNILSSAGPNGHEVWGTQITGGWYSYDTLPDGSFCGSPTYTGTCNAGNCVPDPDQCNKGGRPTTLNNSCL